MVFAELFLAIKRTRWAPAHSQPCSLRCVLGAGRVGWGAAVLFWAVGGMPREGSDWPLYLVVVLWVTTGRAQVGYVTVLMLSRPRDIMLVQSAVIGAARHELAPCWDSVRAVSNLLLRAPSAT